jgi:hypothetical protein
MILRNYGTVLVYMRDAGLFWKKKKWLSKRVTMVVGLKRYTDLSVSGLCVSVSMDDSLNIYTFAGNNSRTMTSKKITLIIFKIRCAPYQYYIRQELLLTAYQSYVT